jgi:hypothetical protein
MVGPAHPDPVVALVQQLVERVAVEALWPVHTASSSRVLSVLM